MSENQTSHIMAQVSYRYLGRGYFSASLFLAEIDGMGYQLKH